MTERGRPGADGASAALRRRIGRLSRRLRARRALEAGVRGLFFGLVAAFIVAAVAGSVVLPGSVLIAVGSAAAGAALGAALGLLRRVDRRRMLVTADRVLGSHELIETGHELAASGAPGLFTGPVIEDAAELLARTPASRALGRRRLRLVPFLAAPAALMVAALLFPVNIPGLFARRLSVTEQLASIGEDLQGLGDRLQEASRAQDLGRRLALSQELAQLGSDLADQRVASDEALDRISNLENGIAREYQLQLQKALAGSRPPSARAGSPSGASGGQDSPSANAPAGSPDAGTDSSDTQDLSGALDRLRDAQKLLQGDNEAGRGASSGQSSGKGGRGGGSAPPGSSGQQSLPGGDNQQPGAGDGGGGSESGLGEPGGPAGSSAGNTPAPTKTGPPTPIEQGGRGTPEQAQGSPGEGDSTSFLVRALPQWTGSKLPAETLRRQYAQSAETALARDEVPPKLSAAVRDYFTDIGMGAGDQPAGGQ